MPTVEDLEAFTSEVANAVECLLPPYYKDKQPVIQQWIIERMLPEPSNVIFYLQVKDLTQDQADKKFNLELFLGMSTKIIPEPDKPLTWRFKDNEPILVISQSLPNRRFARKIGAYAAMAIVSGVLPLVVSYDEEAKFTWDSILNSGINNFLGMEHPIGRDN